ncbi:MAG: TolC family protein [Bacteroidetes bacterium]|nr:TolC family protein [Bacteroidota bacterium]
MNRIIKYFFTLALFCSGIGVEAQEGRVRTVTLEEALDLARRQSPEAIRARNTFMVQYWRNQSYRASFLPALSFDASLPNFSRQIISITATDPETGEARHDFSSDFSSQLSGGFYVRQNLPTGGVVSLGTSLSRIDRFRDNLGNKLSTEYMSTPLNFSLDQSLFGVNQRKWDKKIEPLYYQEAKKNYIKQMEDLAQNVISYFFNLASAQQAVAIAQFNQANNDTLVKIAYGRYQMGTIDESDLLQSELNYSNACSSLNEALLSLENQQNRFRSFLGFNERTAVETLLPNEVPELFLSVDEVLYLAKDHNPALIDQQIQLIQAAKNVAERQASRGFSANLNLSFGLNQVADNLTEAYRNPRDMQTVRIGLSIPILDWGRGKGLVRMAQADQELVKARVDQAMIDFEQEVVLSVRQFNMQRAQFSIAVKADTLAQRRYEVAKQRFLMDRISITDMNNAQIDRDRSRQNYVDALYKYWLYYYKIRQTAQFDFFRKEPLSVDFEELVR